MICLLAVVDLKGNAIKAMSQKHLKSSNNFHDNFSLKKCVFNKDQAVCSIKVPVVEENPWYELVMKTLQTAASMLAGPDFMPRVERLLFDLESFSIL